MRFDEFFHFLVSFSNDPMLFFKFVFFLLRGVFNRCIYIHKIREPFFSFMSFWCFSLNWQNENCAMRVKCINDNFSLYIFRQICVKKCLKLTLTSNMKKQRAALHVWRSSFCTQDPIQFSTTMLTESGTGRIEEIFKSRPSDKMPDPQIELKYLISEFLVINNMFENNK